MLHYLTGPLCGALAKTISCRKLVMIGGLVSCIGMIAISMSHSPLQLGLSMCLVSKSLSVISCAMCSGSAKNEGVVITHFYAVEWLSGVS